MNYLLLSTNDKGGAGIALLKTIEFLREKGHNAKLIVLNKYSSSNASVGLFDNNKTFGKWMILLHQAYAKIKKLLVIGRPKEKYNFFNIGLNRISARKVLSLFGEKPDIIAVGWVTDFITPKTVYEMQLLTSAKVMYIMADDAHITGGCHYPWDCKGFQSNCYPCPALKARNKAASRTLLTNKKYITPEMMISGTTCDSNRARKSILFKNCVIVPSVTIRQNPFHFTKKEGRDRFGISSSDFVILCGAASIKSERKGFYLLIDSLSILKNKIKDVGNITIIVAGGECGEFPKGYNVLSVGNLSFEDLFRAYGASDLFVCPSLEDSGPMMINYGIMGYIPVVAFEMGVALDVIVHKKNGYIAKWGDVNDFADGIKYCIENHFDRNDLKIFNDQLQVRLNDERSRLKYLGLI